MNATIVGPMYMNGTYLPCHPTPTRIPISKRLTCSPSFTITPATSCPGTLTKIIRVIQSVIEIL